MKKVFQKFEAFCNVAAEAASWVASAMVMLMCVVILIDVIGRYFFNSPLIGSSEMVELMMNIFAYSGLLYAMYKRNYIKIPVVLDMLKPKAREIVDIVIQFLSFVICTLLSYSMWVATVEWMHKWTVTTTVLGIPYTPFYFFTALSLTLITFHTIIQFIHQMDALLHPKKAEDAAQEGAVEA